MAAKPQRESSTQEESSRPTKRQKLDAFVSMALDEYKNTTPETWKPHELHSMFNNFGPEVVTCAKASAYLHTYRPGFAKLQERYHNMKLMPLDEAEDGVLAGYSNDKLKPKAKLCANVIRMLGEIQMATKTAQNMPTYYEAVEMRAAFAMVLVSAQEERVDGAKKFVPDIHDVLRELVEILEERHETSKAPAIFSPVMVTDAAATGATTKAAPGDFKSDEYIKERVKNHKLDLANTAIMDWDDLQGIDNVKQALEHQYSLLSVQEANSKVGICMRGLLLHGEQGTVKTSVAYSFAKSHGIQMCSLDSTVFGSLPGQTCRLLELIFEDIYARLPSPSIILMDDAVGILGESNIGPDGDGLGLYQLQKHLKVLWAKAISDQVPLFVIATTIRPEEISMEDFRRRFRIIRHVGLPDEAIRRALWQQEMNGRHHSLSEADFQLLAARSAGMSAADINALVDDTESSLLSEVTLATAFAYATINGQPAYIPVSENSPGALIKTYERMIPQLRKVVWPAAIEMPMLQARFESKDYWTVSRQETMKHQRFQATL